MKCVTGNVAGVGVGDPVEGKHLKTLALLSD